jgi:hypothetical protein
MLKPQLVRLRRERRLFAGMRISADQPVDVIAVAASQTASQFAFSPSPWLVMRASYRAPFGFTAKTNPERPSRYVSSTSLTWSSLERSASRARANRVRRAESGSSARMPMISVVASASTRTTVRPLGVAPSVGSISVRSAIESAPSHDASSRRPSRSMADVTRPTRRTGRSVGCRGGWADAAWRARAKVASVVSSIRAS